MNFLKTDWVSIDIHNEALQFVYERWGELLHSRTPVSHQAPVSGAPQILREWLEAHALLEETGFGKASLQAVEEEAFGVEVKPHGERRGTVETDRIVCKLVGDFASLRRAMKHHFSRGNAKDSLENQR